MMGMIGFAQDTSTGEVVMIPPKFTSITGGPAKMLDWHDHFDPINQYGKNFRRMKGVEFVTEERTFTLPSGVTVSLECMVQFKMTYVVLVSEDKKLCPMDARLNPDWRCKEWEETKTECFTFYGQNKETIEKNASGLYNTHALLLDEAGECVTRVRGRHASFISKLEISTNFGRTLVVGHDYPLAVDPVYLAGGYGLGVKDVEERRFELDIPPCSKVVCFIGSYNADLFSIAAFYN